MPQTTATSNPHSQGSQLVVTAWILGVTSDKISTVNFQSEIASWDLGGAYILVSIPRLSTNIRPLHVTWLSSSTNDGVRQHDLELVGFHASSNRKTAHVPGFWIPCKGDGLILKQDLFLFSCVLWFKNVYECSKIQTRVSDFEIRDADYPQPYTVVSRKGKPESTAAYTHTSMGDSMLWPCLRSVAPTTEVNEASNLNLDLKFKVNALVICITHVHTCMICIYTQVYVVDIYLYMFQCVCVQYCMAYLQLNVENERETCRIPARVLESRQRNIDFINVKIFPVTWKEFLQVLTSWTPFCQEVLD